MNLPGGDSELKSYTLPWHIGFSVLGSEWTILFSVFDYKICKRRNAMQPVGHTESLV